MAAMLTTVDNPNDPRVDFPAWLAWDLGQGYNTCGYLARVARTSDGFPQALIDAQIDQAMDEIIEMHGGGLYKKLPVDDA